MSYRTKIALAAGAAGLAAAGFALAATASSAAPQPKTVNFGMVRSAAAQGAGCLANAHASVKVTPNGITEIMDVDVSGMPANTDFDLFVIQVPNAPFGVSWYQGDLETDADGNGHGEYVGRFSVETFAVAPGTAAAPSVHSSPIADATSNPAFGPIHTYHLGLWFNDPADAGKAGCPTAVTPFNGDHNAGVQALSTRNAPDDKGPLRHVVS
jgi:hypothetical protein